MNHFHCFGNLIGVKRDSDHIEHAFVGVADLFLPVALLGIRHRGELESGVFGVMVADDPAKVFLVAVPPRPEIFFWKQSRRILVTNFHRVDPGGDARLVHGPHKIIGKQVIVDQAPVPNRAVKHFEFRTVCDPGSFFRHKLPRRGANSNYQGNRNPGRGKANTTKAGEFHVR